VALVLNIIFLLGALSVMDATLTLPGIAGIVLTIGMAVDANVLIFERIREELVLGKSLRGSISAGYDKAFSTILDANVTTLIASTILMYMGSGPVKGFGVTLTTGVIISMFTALFVTRLVFDALLKYNVISSIKMLQLLKSTNIDFFKFSKQAFIVSWVLIIAGCGYGAMRGGDVLGVDFAGGDSLTLKFEERVGVDQIRAEVEKMEVGSPMIQYQKDVSTGHETLQITTEFETGEKVEQALKAAFPSSEFYRIKLDVVGPSVGNEILISAVVSTFLALFGILVYVAFRYEFSFSIGAVIAVVHDVLMTLGWFFLTGRELSAPMVAAVLTIIGFSMNDTIVIFDRIREDIHSGARGTFREIINHALNKTLSRTVITSGTSLLAALSLYIFGGGVINDFAFTFVIGIITGTYSSIYIAANIVHWWHKGQRPEIHSTFIAEEEGKAASVAQV
jgi:SecD/SecF fusion protein